MTHPNRVPNPYAPARAGGILHTAPAKRTPRPPLTQRLSKRSPASPIPGISLTLTRRHRRGRGRPQWTRHPPPPGLGVPLAPVDPTLSPASRHNAHVTWFAEDPPSSCIHTSRPLSHRKRVSASRMAAHVREGSATILTCPRPYPRGKRKVKTTASPPSPAPGARDRLRPPIRTRLGVPWGAASGSGGWGRGRGPAGGRLQWTKLHVTEKRVEPGPFSRGLTCSRRAGPPFSWLSEQT